MGEIAINSHFTQKIDWRAYGHQMRHIFLIKYTTCMRDFFSQSERLKRRKVDTSTILTTPSLKWRWYHLSTIITVLSVTIGLQIVFAHIAFYAYSLAQWRNHVMVLAFLVSLKLCENFDGSTSEPAMRSCDTGQRIPCFDNISVVRKTDGQGYGQVTTQI